ncbi:hypothetical protein GALMADRAFT_145277 [Galerina marginata CBS 339.88]|uniref:Uncharacterized protein n=1 Tax=Galerina marginata (strain CBS 339.88) TaxID=685588 RepID=A0A067SSY7_GALM3|nr:hypothetical protein GALMADRAFT_145277 [Galerina marginata CBS 339.88]
MRRHSRSLTLRTPFSPLTAHCTAWKRLPASRSTHMWDATLGSIVWHGKKVEPDSPSPLYGGKGKESEFGDGVTWGLSPTPATSQSPPITRASTPGVDGVNATVAEGYRWEMGTRELGTTFWVSGAGGSYRWSGPRDIE